MKTLEELRKEKDFHYNEYSRLLNEVFHHPDFIVHWFEKLNITEDDTYLKDLISKVQVVRSDYFAFRFSIDNKHYKVVYNRYWGKKIDNFTLYCDGASEYIYDENEYKKYRKQGHKKILGYFGKYFKNKKEKGYLSNLLKESDVEDCVKIAFLLMLNEITR
ncbi:hypothetical protein EDM57_04425 [Brevibacillus gelatini]|uniref:Uncharacterized protein n=1 Tax=Brevibacillus gelatini TaxID=1655277 RepID=A0A3M8B7V1_9BACL|nr:hypothetical protein [Brevibacillus gelatini]RNB59393.1 hypothetical protein EDM57_04425 [Brevibacillus gelatini]